MSEEEFEESVREVEKLRMWLMGLLDRLTSFRF